MSKNSTNFYSIPIFRDASAGSYGCLLKAFRYPVRCAGVLLFILCSFQFEIYAQHVLNGTVVDEKGASLPGATVILKDTNKGMVTDIEGKFLMEVPSPQSIIQISFIGFNKLETPAGTERVRTFKLTADSSAKLKEVVIVGFGTQKKSTLVGSMSTIKGETLRMPTRDLTNNLAGQVPGIIAVQRSGEPGYDGSEFYIRGMATFNEGRGALVLVDGVPRNMNDIDPDEIESFSVLKDASATAVYGAEGANGVILITSKRGRVQQTSISYRGEGSVLTPTRVPQFANSYDYLYMFNEALINEGKAPAYSADILEKYRSGVDPDLYPSTNWWDATMRDRTWNTRHTLNFRGGNQRARFFTSGSYFEEAGIWKTGPEEDYDNNINLNRYNLRSNIDLDVTKTTLLSIDLSGQYLRMQLPQQGTGFIMERLTRIPPHLIPAVYSDGTQSQHPSYNGNKQNPYNLVMHSGYKKEWRSQLQSKVNLNQKLDFITPGLAVRGAVAFDSDSRYSASRGRAFESKYATGRDADGNLVFTNKSNAGVWGEPTEGSNGDKSIYVEGAFDYKRQIGRHDLNGLLLGYQKELQLSGDALAYRKQGYVGRLTYAFDSRYSIEGSFGFTGSEQFADGYRWGFFPAIGLAWNVVNEAFIPEAIKGVVSNFKLRGSFGRTGNDNVGGTPRFLYRPTFGNGGAYSWGIGTTGPSNSMTGLNEGRFEAPYLSWEIELKRNVGLDASFFNGKINLVADYFNNYRDNILLPRQTISGVAGLRQSPFQNFGIVTNKGFDGSIDFNHKVRDWTFSGRGNFTFARNKVVERDEIPDVHPWMNETGLSVNNPAGTDGLFVAERLFEETDFNVSTGANGQKVYTLKSGIADQSSVTKVPFGETAPGDIKFKDLNNDGVIDAFDRTLQGFDPLIPEIIYGFGLTAGFKGFYASAFFQGAGNTSINLNSASNMFIPFHWGIEESNVRQEVVNSRWTQENPSQNVFYPRMRQEFLGAINTPSTWWIKDGSFVRLKNIELGYRFGANVLRKGKMKAARLYLMGQNVAIWDKVKVYDPELGNTAGGVKYPIPSIWTAGLDITF